MNLAELKLKKIDDLVKLARKLKVDGFSSLRKQELIFAILQAQADKEGQLRGNGVLEILPDGIPFGNEGGVLDGNVSEAVVTAILWDLYDTENEVIKYDDGMFRSVDPYSNKSTAIWDIITSSNLNDRGESGVDLVDFIDGWYCNGYGVDVPGVDYFRLSYDNTFHLTYDFNSTEACR